MSELDFLGEEFRAELARMEPSRQEHVLRCIVLAVLGVIPWVGGFMAAIASIKDGLESAKVDNLQRQWLEEHARKIQELSGTLEEMMQRLHSFGAETKDRLESKEYLSLIRSGFRQWDQADSDEKKKLIVNLLTNAGAAKITTDDVVQLFLDWIDTYHEIHFAVIRAIFKSPGITRKRIWQQLHDSFPKENSAEADLFKLLIRDLSTGGVIRQHRETDYYGNFQAKPRSKPTVGGKPITSAFDDEDGYELTALGNQFVSYTMNEVVSRVE